METRRDSLKLLTGGSLLVAAAGKLAAQEHPHTPGGLYAVPVIPPFAPLFFNESEARMMVKLVDLIIPRTDTPGGSDAGVPQFIDSAALARPELGIELRAGCQWLASQDFLGLSDQAAAGLLAPLNDPGDSSTAAAFLRQVKNLTIDGYYGSYPGLVKELGYQGNQALATFEGCGHDH